MKNITLLGGFLIVLLFSFSACTKYDPIYGVADTKNTGQLTLKKDLVYIHDYDIYMVNEILADVKRLTNSPSDPKTHIAFSPAHDKIAYLDINGTPVIIDTSGNVIQTLSTYTNVKDLKWHANNGNPTLYMLVNNAIEFHGPSLSIPSLPFDYVFPSNATFTAIDAVEIDNNLNIAFSYRFQRPYASNPSWQEFLHGVGMNFSSGSDRYRATQDGYYTASSSYAAQAYPYYHSVSINTLDQTVILGEISNGFESSYNYYYLERFDYTSNGLSNFSAPLSSSNCYQKYTKGITYATPSQIQKYLNVLPPGVPQATGTANTFNLFFTNQNNVPPTYFDWKP